MVIPDNQAFGIYRPDNYSIERVNAKYLTEYFEKHHAVNVTTSFPRTSLKVPLLVVSNPTSVAEWASLGGYAGGTPGNTVTHTAPRKYPEEEIKRAPTVTGKAGLLVTGNVTVAVMSDTPDSRDKLAVWTLGAYIEALSNGWFTNPANFNEGFDEKTGRRGLITIAGWKITNFTKGEFETTLAPKYIYNANINLQFKYHLNVEFVRALISAIEEEYQVVDP